MAVEGEAPPHFKILSHTADTGIVAYGATLAEAFEHSAEAMYTLMFAPWDASPTEKVDVEAGGDSAEDLLVGWLSELLYLGEARELALWDFRITRLGTDFVWGQATGIPYTEVQLIGPPIKAVTYHLLEISQTRSGWKARVIFDV